MILTEIAQELAQARAANAAEAALAQPKLPFASTSSYIPAIRDEYRRELNQRSEEECARRHAADLYHAGHECRDVLAALRFESSADTLLSVLWAQAARDDGWEQRHNGEWTKSLGETTPQPSARDEQMLAAARADDERITAGEMYRDFPELVGEALARSSEHVPVAHPAATHVRSVLRRRLQGPLRLDESPLHAI